MSGRPGPEEEGAESRAGRADIRDVWGREDRADLPRSRGLILKSVVSPAAPRPGKSTGPQKLDPTSDIQLGDSPDKQLGDSPS